MKELRPAQTIRVLFAFDPRRTAILLIGGDKRGSWNRWYDQMLGVPAPKIMALMRMGAKVANLVGLGRGRTKEKSEA